MHDDASKFNDAVVDEYMANVSYFKWSRDMVHRVATRLKKLRIFRDAQCSHASLVSMLKSIVTTSLSPSSTSRHFSSSRTSWRAAARPR